MPANITGTNGPRPRATTGRTRQSLSNMLSKGQVNYSSNPGGALDNPTKLPKPQVFDPVESVNKMKELNTKRRVQTVLRTSQAPKAPDYTPALQGWQAAAGQAAARANVTALAYAALRSRSSGQTGGGDNKGVIGQIATGFEQAGDSELARFVRRNPSLVRIWLGQESGMRKDAVSPVNNLGYANYGAFQFWGGHPWVQRLLAGRGLGGFRRQARLAERHFDLSPAEIRRYVEQIRAGSYKGWG